MEIIVIALTAAVILRDPPGTIRAATAYKNAQIQKTQTKGGGAHRPGRRALRNYLGTIWEAKWEEAARRYPEKMRAAQQRRQRRKAKRTDQWDRAKATADRRWQERHNRGQSPLIERPGAGAPVPDSGAAPPGVVDLDEARRRRDTPTPDSDTRDTTTEEEPMNLSDATSLRAHLEALRGYGTYWDQAATAKERLAANMRTNGVGESTVGALDSSRDASSSAAAAARMAADGLEQANMAVAEARAGSPDAGHGSYYERH